MPAQPLLLLDHLARHYRKNGDIVRALDGVTLEIRAGDFISIQGPSGCGKTTLLLACGLMLTPDAGKVVLDGIDTGPLAPEARARLRATRIGFVFQQFHLIPYLTVRQNILAPAITARGGTDRAAAAARADSLADRFGLRPRLRHYPSELSTGERQRTALARALLNRPAILLADEPSGNLDTANATTVLDALGDFCADGGAVLLVTHDDRAAARATTKLRMRDGKIVG